MEQNIQGRTHDPFVWGFHVVPSNDITDFYVVREGTVGSICLTIPQMVVC